MHLAFILLFQSCIIVRLVSPWFFSHCWRHLCVHSFSPSVMYQLHGIASSPCFCLSSHVLTTRHYVSWPIPFSINVSHTRPYAFSLLAYEWASPWWRRSRYKVDKLCRNLALGRTFLRLEPSQCSPLSMCWWGSTQWPCYPSSLLSQ